MPDVKRRNGWRAALLVIVATLGLGATGVAVAKPPLWIVRSPKATLVLVGQYDGECPMPQSREFWLALKTLGVKTQLVIYPGEGHEFFQSEHKRDVIDRLTGWFDQYLK